MSNLRAMSLGARFVVGVAVLTASFIVSTPLLAATICTAQPSRHDDRFGLMSLGTKIKDISKDARLKPCASGGECVYVDELGIVYESKDGIVIDGKGFDLSPVKRNDLPLGLTSDDSIADFMRKIVPEHDAYASIFRSGSDKIIVLSGPCYANAKGVVFQVVATFANDGRLSGVGIAAAADVQDALAFRDQLLKPK